MSAQLVLMSADIAEGGVSGPTPRRRDRCMNPRYSCPPLGAGGGGGKGLSRRGSPSSMSPHPGSQLPPRRQQSALPVISVPMLLPATLVGCIIRPAHLSPPPSRFRPAPRVASDAADTLTPLLFRPVFAPCHHSSWLSWLTGKCPRTYYSAPVFLPPIIRRMATRTDAPTSSLVAVRVSVAS